MIPSQTFETFPVFGSNATKVEPGDAKKAAGWQQADVVPAEWMNWEWYKASKGITDLNSGVSSIEKEINAVLTDMGITPAEATEDQLKQALAKIRPQMGSCSTAAGTAAKTVSITGNVLKPGSIYVIEMTNQNSASNPTLSINNSTAYPICNADGNAIGKGAWNAGAAITVIFTGSKYIMFNSAPTNTIENGSPQSASSHAVYNYKTNKIENGNDTPIISDSISCHVYNSSLGMTGPALGTGARITVMFTADINGQNDTTGLVVQYNEEYIPVKVNKNGVLVPFKAANISTNVYKYIQANTVIGFIYLNGEFIIIGNPVVLSSSSYTIYADGKVGNEPIGTLLCYNGSVAPYGYLICDGAAGTGSGVGTFDTTKYADLYAFLGSDKVPNYLNKFIMGSGADPVGTEKIAGLPEIEGSASITNAGSGQALPLDIYPVSGCFGREDTGTVFAGDVNSWQETSARTLTFKASQSNGIYGNSNTVQPPARTALICIKAL